MENIVRKGEIACLQAISPLLTMFSTVYKQFLLFSQGFPQLYIFSLSKWVNHVTNDKISNKYNLKDFPNDKINATYILNFVLGRTENIVGKGENAGFPHFLLVPLCFQNASFSMWLTLSQTSPCFYVSSVQVF